MLYFAGKIVWALINPFAVAVLSLALAVFAGWRGRRKAAVALSTFSLSVLLFFSSGFAVWMLGLPLESPYVPEKAAEDYCRADAIVLLGGGMSFAEGGDFVYGDCNSASDRVWHAARLYRAGKAPVVVVSGTNDLASTALLLKQAGVPDAALRFDGESRNTAENFANVAAMLRGGKDGSGAAGARPRVLVATSAWHMRRALLIAERAGLDAIPAPCDYIAAPGFSAAKSRGELPWGGFSVGVENLNNSSILLKEWIGWLQKKICG